LFQCFFCDRVYHPGHLIHPFYISPSWKEENKYGGKELKKLLIPLAIFLVSAFIITGCNSGTTSPAATTSAVATSATAAPATTPAATGPAATVPGATTPAATKPAATAAAGSQQYGGTLRYITAAGPGAPIGAPWLANGTSTFGMQFAEQFLVREESDASIQPCLAASWDIVSDSANPSITFHLVKGVKFQDGSDFNAAAVKWNLQQAMSQGSTTMGSTTNWKSIDVIDDSTIRVNLKTWQIFALRTFGDSVAFMVSPTAYQKNGADWMSYNMVGTGPFTQTSFQRDVALNLAKNTNYWEQGKPYMDAVQYLFVSDALTAEALFRSGGAEVLQNYSDQMASRMQAAGYTLIRSQVPSAANLWPDSANADSPWSNLKVRQAAEYALDKESMAKAFGYGNWTAAYQYNTSVSPAYDPTLVARKYDVAKAKQLLTEAGYPNGFKTSIIVSPFGANQDIAAAMQAMWNAVGIKTDLQYPQAGAWSAMLTGTWHNAVLFGPGPLSANPIAGWNLSFSPGTAWYGSLKRPDNMADLFKAAAGTTTVDPVLAQKCEAALFNDVTNIPLYFSANSWTVTSKVNDSGLGTRGTFAWLEPQNAWLSK
jgi:peptide/nickel transport system substrate-binding protein